MKLIIDIPYESYYTFKSDLGKGNLNALAEIVANGTPYEERPQGDLISREALRKAFHERIYYFNKSSWDEANAIIDNAPTVEQFDDTELQRAVGYADGYLKGREERPQGEWIDHEKHIECNHCRVWFLKDYLIRKSFCPNCGADMRTKEAENEQTN